MKHPSTRIFRRVYAEIPEMSSEWQLRIEGLDYIANNLMRGGAAPSCLGMHFSLMREYRTMRYFL